MTTGGWIFMVTSLTFVVTLAVWCYRRLLSAPDPGSDAASTDER